MKIARYKKVEKEDCINISPSSIHTYFENPRVWYENSMLGKSSFTGNTNTVFGSVLHAVAEAYALGLDVSIDDVKEYLEDYKDNPNVDEWYVLGEFEAHKKVLLEFMRSRPTPNKVEIATSFEPIDGYAISGTCDYVTGTTVGDYKTVSSFSKTIKTQWKYQLILYALSLRANGIEIDNIEVVQIKRGDSKGKVSEKTGNIIGIKKPTIETLIEPITDEDIQMVKEDVTLLIRCLKMIESDTSGDLAELMFRTNRLSYIQE